MFSNRIAVNVILALNAIALFRDQVRSNNVEDEVGDNVETVFLRVIAIHVGR